MTVTTPRKREANRRNARRSTGPRTPEGKAAVALNAIKHGFCARTVVIPGEDAGKYAVLRAGLRADFRPRGMLEEVLVERLAAGAWRLRRAGTLEAAMFEQEMYDEAVRRGRNPRAHKDSPPPLFGRYAFWVFRDRDVEALARHEQRLEKAFFRTLDELRKARAARGADAPGAEPPDGDGLPPGPLADLAAPLGAGPLDDLAPPEPPDEPEDAPAAETGETEPTPESSENDATETPEDQDDDQDDGEDEDGEDDDEGEDEGEDDDEDDGEDEGPAGVIGETKPTLENSEYSPPRRVLRMQPPPSERYLALSRRLHGRR